MGRSTRSATTPDPRSSARVRGLPSGRMLDRRGRPADLRAGPRRRACDLADTHEACCRQLDHVIATAAFTKVVEQYDAEIRAVSMIVKVPAVIRLRKAFRRHPKPVKFSRVNIYARDGYRCQYCSARCRIGGSPTTIAGHAETRREPSRRTTSRTYIPNLPCCTRRARPGSGGERHCVHGTLYRQHRCG